MTTTITSLPTANTIDSTQDWLAIDTTSLATTQKINRDTLLGITSTPLGTTDSQSMTNKTIGNTNTVTIKDTLFTLQDDGDTTKQARFQLSGITTATTRTYTLPNASSTLADTSTSQTFTNKTLTSPTINGGTITGPTLAVDSIAGQSVSTSVTVAGLNISSGVLNTNNSVVTANIADSAVTPAKLQTGTGSGWGWSSWTPTFTNFTLGNGTINTSKYIQIGKTVFFKIRVTLGSTSSVSGAITFSLPVTAAADENSSSNPNNLIGFLNILDNGTTQFSGFINVASTTTANLLSDNAASTTAQPALTSSTSPMTWTTNDAWYGRGSYEAA